MRIAVIGAGGVGGPFGAALAKAGGDVTFVARGAHLAAMRTLGLKVLGPRGDVHLVPTQATDEPATIGPVDFVLFCVKLWDVESAGAAIRPRSPRQLSCLRYADPDASPARRGTIREQHSQRAPGLPRG